MLDKNSIAKLPKTEFLKFFESFLALLRRMIKKTTQLAFINANWRDFQNAPAVEKHPEGAILIFEYHKIFQKTGWQPTHVIQAPMSAERFHAGVVSAMQKKKILGVTSRYVIVLKNSLNKIAI